MEIKTTYLEMTKILSGTNKISICFNSLIAHTLKKYNLSDDSVPLHLLHHTIENFYYNFQISGLVPSFMYIAGKYDFIYEYFKQRLNLKFNEKFFNAILVFPVEENVNFINSIFKEGTFVFLMNDMYFEFPFIYTHLLTAPLKTYFCDTKHELNEFDEIIDENILKKINEIYKESEPIFYSIKVSDKLKEQMKSVTKEYFYDPHIHYSLVNKLTCPDLTAENLTQYFGKNLHFANKICTSNLSELDYRINVEEKSVKEQQNYASHLKMLSSSLGTDNLFPLSQKEKSEVKTSSKTRKIVEENLKKLRLAEKQKENDFLKLLFDKYQSSTDKYLFFETLKINDTFEEAKRKVVLLKIEFFYNEWLTESRKEKPFEGKKVNCYFNILNYIEKYHSTFLEEFDWSIDILRKLGFESTAHELVEKEKLDTGKYNFKKEATSNDNDISFLLKYYGPYLKRSVDSRKDPRVFFEPDFWQVQLLDLIDENKSVIVSAPTSSGKTFICFYVIHKLLSLTDQIILFILPTKALVNQVTADIYSRFSQRTTKQFLQGQIMQEYSINPFNSQVILTIPSMAEQILLTRKVSYVILDECHLICENESVERILHVVKCPIVMLSATVGNINEFYEQVYEIFRCKSNTLINNSKNNDCNTKNSNFNNLKNSNFNNLKNNNGNNKKSNFNNKKSNGNNSDDKLIYCIEYKERYCDIKPFVFNNTLIPINTLFAYTYDYIKEYGFTNDLNFLPDEILNLYYSIYHVIKNKSLIHEIRPQKYFKSNLLNKRDVILYENYLLKTVQRWINEKMLSEKEVNKLYYLLTKESREVFEELKKIKPNDTSDDNSKEVYYFTTIDYMLNNIFNLCNTLKSKEMLPCIIFNTDRRIVDLLALRLYNELSNLNVSDTRIKDKLLKEKKRTRDVIEKGKDVWKSKSIQEEEEYSLLKEKYEYSFTDEKYKLSDYELKEMTNNIKNTSTIYKNMLKLGIGLHHEGMNKKFRSVIEILFRKKHLQVIFATDTLSLGINMPCKTVVFTNDILYSLAYKQMSGRAGRRGYDLQGNVVFYGVEENKVKNMIISDRNTIITKNIINYVEVIYCTNEFIRESFVNHSMFITKLINYLKKSNSTNNSVDNLSNNSINSSINQSNNTSNSNQTINQSNNNSVDLNNNSIDNLNYKLGILNKSDVNKSIDLFINKRNDLFNYKRNVLLQLNYLINDNKTYLSDILILNKDKQLECMIMLYLIHSDLIKLDKLSLLEVLVHFFGVIHKVIINEEKGILPDLPCKKEINHLIYYLNNKPIPHFYWLNLHSKKDDYILQFMFNNIKNDIKVLFKGLKEINDFVKSVICVYEIFNVEEEIVKKLVIFIKWFEPKFSNIYS